MLKPTNDPIGRAESLIEAWRTTEPTRSFYGLSLDGYLAAVQPVYDVDEEIADLAKRTRAAKARRKDLRIVISDLTQNVVHAVKADPAVGENSPMYAAMGYVRKSDRYGSRRRQRAAVAPGASESDVKPESLKS
jgi:hypothetical protein